MKNWTKVATTALFIVMGANVVLAGGYLLQKRQLARDQQYSRQPGANRMPAIAGVAVSGDLWKSSGAGCHMVRVTEDSCAYCRKDRPNYERLIETALQANCEVIEVAPRAGKLALDVRPGVVQMKFVTTDLGPAVYPFVTPQTVLLNENWEVAYIRRGMFSEQALGDATAAIRSLARRAAAIDGAKLTSSRR